MRAGDVGAYATLYELHSSAVQRLARRLCRDAYEADDVVSDVFTNSLRAIQHGGGPNDDFAAYALRAVRNTVNKLRTRTDTARATPTEDAALDRARPDDPYRLAGDIERAFTDLPERFQHVLWSTAVEGATATELAEQHGDGQLDPGAAASLSMRARKALGRSYLRVRTQRPARHPECSRVRTFLPGYVQHNAAPATTARVEAHLEVCPDCAEVHVEMCALNGKLRTTPWMALLAAAIRNTMTSVAGIGTPIAATAVAAPVVVVAVAGTLIAQRDADPDTPRVSTSVVADVAPAIAVVDPAPASGLAEVPIVGIPRDPDGTVIAGSGATLTFGTPTPPADPRPTTATPAPAPADGVPDVDAAAVPGTTAPAGSATTPTTTIGPAPDDPDGAVAAPPSGSPSTPAGTGDVVTGLGDTLNGTTDALGSTVADVGTLVGDAVSGLGEAVGGPVGSLVTDVGTAVGGLVSGVGTTLDQTGDGLAGTVEAVTDVLAGLTTPTTTAPPASTTTTAPACTLNLLGLCISLP